MVTKIITLNGGKFAADKFNNPVRPVAEFFGLSTDTKPTNAKDADIFYEKDTRKVFLFDEDGRSWLEQ